MLVGVGAVALAGHVGGLVRVVLMMVMPAVMTTVR